MARAPGRKAGKRGEAGRGRSGPRKKPASAPAQAASTGASDGPQCSPGDAAGIRRAQRREREREQRRQTILSAAESLFATKGYHATSMEDVADQAEVSVGTLYFYFKNKADILAELVRGISLDLRTLLGKEFQADATIRGFLRAADAFFTKFCIEYPEKAFILLKESVGAEPVVEQSRRNLYEKLADDMIAAVVVIVAAGGAVPVDARSLRVAVLGVLGAFERVAYQFLVPGGKAAEMAGIARDAVSFLVGGLSTVVKGLVTPPADGPGSILLHP